MAALEATIVQVRQLLAYRASRPAQYIATDIREVVQEDFKQPIEKTVEGPILSIQLAAYHAREAVGQMNREVRFQNRTVFALVLDVGSFGGTAS